MPAAPRPPDDSISRAVAAAMRPARSVASAKRFCTRYEEKFENRKYPPSRKNATISSDGMKPMKIYEMISLRRTRHSSRRRATARPRIRKYPPPTASATEATVSTTRRNDGTAANTPTVSTISFTATPRTMARPGSVRSSASFIGVDLAILDHVS
jgi:hypothetical protein